MIAIDTSSMPHIYVVTRHADGDHRRPIKPGEFVGGTWVATDLSNEPEEVRQAAIELWTDDVVESFKAAFPWAPPPPPPPNPTPEEKLAAAGLTQDEFDALVAAAIARQQG